MESRYIIAKRTMGVTEPVDVDDFNFIRDSVREVKDHAGHDIQVRAHHRITTPGYALVLVCLNCSMVWHRHLKPYTMNSTILGRAALQHEMLALFMGPMEEECFGVREIQLMAEFLTQQLVSAGPEGMSLNALIRSIVTNDMAPGGKVCRAIDDLAFEDFQHTLYEHENGDLQVETRLRLPTGHPLRSW